MGMARISLAARCFEAAGLAGGAVVGPVPSGAGFGGDQVDASPAPVGEVAVGLAERDNFGGPQCSVVEAAVERFQVLAAGALGADPSEQGTGLAALAERLAAADPPNPALIDQALAVAETIPHNHYRGVALARLHALTVAACWRSCPADDSGLSAPRLTYSRSPSGILTKRRPPKVLVSPSWTWR